MDILSTLWDNFSGMLASILPKSPFQQFIGNFKDIPYLNYLNWFIPIGDILSIFAVYLTCVTLYYLYSIILRWIRALE